MKLLIITPIYPPEIGGPATYSQELLQRLPREGIDTRVLSFTNLKKTRVDDSNVQLVHTGGSALGRQLRLLVSCVENSWSADVVFLQEPLVVGLAGILGAKLLNKPVISKYVGDPSWERARDSQSTDLALDVFLKQKLVRRSLSFLITKFVLQKSDKVITPSKYLKRILTTCYGLSTGQVSIVYNSVEIKKSAASKKHRQIIFVGRLVAWKNIDLVIESFEKVIKMLPDIKLKIVGNGPLLQKLKQLVKKKGLIHQVVFTGALDKGKTLREIAKSLVLILFSDYEGLPHVALEAMAQRTAVVASDIPGTDEVVIDGKSGKIVEQKNVDELAEQIIRIVNNTNERKKLEDKATAWVEGNFRWERNLNKLGKVFYEEIGK